MVMQYALKRSTAAIYERIAKQVGMKLVKGQLLFWEKLLFLRGGEAMLGLHNKGQGLVEFAIVLLIAIPFFIGGYLVFMLSYDYMTIASLARESARALAVQTSANMPQARSELITRKKGENASLGSYYSWNPSLTVDWNPASSVTSAQEAQYDFVYTYGVKAGVSESYEKFQNPYVRVAITAHRTKSGLVDIFGILPDTIQASSTMYWEQYGET